MSLYFNRRKAFRGDTLTTNAFQSNATTKYVTFPDNALFDFGSGNFSVRFLFNWGASQTNSFIMGKESSSSDRSWRIQLNTGLMRFEYSTNGTSYTAINASSVTWSNNTWYDVGYVRDGSDFKFYIDGALKDTQSIAGTLNDSSGLLNVGRTELYPSTLTFPGSFTNFFICDEALTLTDFQNMYNSGEPAAYGSMDSGTEAKLDWGVNLTNDDATANDLIGSIDGTKNGSIAGDGESITFFTG
jgi:hypothetical protein